MLEFELRPPTESEQAFVYAGWINNSLPRPPIRMTGQDRAMPVSMNQYVWAQTLKLRVERLLPFTCVAAAGPALLGFICAQRETLHFLFVDPKMRRHGLSKEMLDRWPMALQWFSFWTPLTEQVPHRGLIWNEKELELR